MKIEFHSLGCVDYKQAELLQADYSARRQRDEIGDTILFLEHPPVYTHGKQNAEEDFRKDPEWITQRGIAVLGTDRGGRLTYHGPGQVVGYLILKLEGWKRSVPVLVERIERAIVETLSHWGIEGCRDDAFPGVWVKEGEGLAKIAAIGLHISHGVTRHGFALNVAPNLSHYEGIVPCGIVGRGVTSMKKILGARCPSQEEVIDCLQKSLLYYFTANILNQTVREISMQGL